MVGMFHKKFKESIFSFSFALMQKKQKIKENTIAPRVFPCQRAAKATFRISKNILPLHFRKPIFHETIRRCNFCIGMRSHFLESISGFVIWKDISKTFQKLVAE